MPSAPEREKRTDVPFPDGRRLTAMEVRDKALTSLKLTLRIVKMERGRVWVAVDYETEDGVLVTVEHDWPVMTGDKITLMDIDHPFYVHIS